MEFLDWVGQEIFIVDSNMPWHDIKTNEHLLPKGRLLPLLLNNYFLQVKYTLSCAHFRFYFANSFGSKRWQSMASWQRLECWASKVWVCCCYIWACPLLWLCCKSPFCPGLVTCCCSPHFTSSHCKMFRLVPTSGWHCHKGFLSAWRDKYHWFFTN